MLYREGAEILSITFPLGTFLPPMPVGHLVDRGEVLPPTSATAFWLGDFSWLCPGDENVETGVNELVRKGLLVHDPVVDAALQDQGQAMSKRSIQRRFRHATGVSLRTLQAIDRAQHVARLLRLGTSVLDTVEEAGSFDQPHLTRALKRFIGQTPTQISRMAKP